VAPLNHWSARGVRVALGIDEAGINDDRDMLQEMRVALRDGELTRVNKTQVLEELAASLRVPWQPEEERRRRLSREVFPYVEGFYAGWLDEKARDPFYRSSSRQ